MKKPIKDDEYYMDIALTLARRAEKRDEVPVGAVVVKNGRVISRAYNLREHRQDPSAHAEHIAMTRAAKRLGSWRLTDCTLYVTLEPCPMCAGLALNARLPRLVYGASDPHSGAINSSFDLTTGCNHTVDVTGGVLTEECSKILSEYFKKKREKK